MKRVRLDFLKTLYRFSVDLKNNFSLRFLRLYLDPMENPPQTRNVTVVTKSKTLHQPFRLTRGRKASSLSVEETRALS